MHFIIGFLKVTLILDKINLNYLSFFRKMGFAGGMVWALDLDDFKNRCGEGHHPLMNQIKAVLGPKMTADEEAARSQRCVLSY